MSSDASMFQVVAAFLRHQTASGSTAVSMGEALWSFQGQEGRMLALWNEEGKLETLESQRLLDIRVLRLLKQQREEQL